MTAQKARSAIEFYEHNAKKANAPSHLDAIENAFMAARSSGSLAQRVREVVLENRSKSKTIRKAA